jgi:hypothetical protein
LDQCGITAFTVSSLQVVPLLGARWPGSHHRGPHTGALQLHLHGPGEALQAGLGGDVAGHVGALTDDHIGGDEHQVAMPGLHHGATKPTDQPVGTGEVDLNRPHKVIRVDAQRALGCTSPALETTTSTGPNASWAVLANASIDASSVRSSAARSSLAPDGPDGGGQLVEAIGAAGAQHHRVAGGGQRLGGGCADAGRGAGDDGNPPLWMGDESRHLFTLSVTSKQTVEPNTCIIA